MSRQQNSMSAGSESDPGGIGGTADRQQPKAPAGAPPPTANAEDAQTSPSADPAPAGPGKTEPSPAARQQAAAGETTSAGPESDPGGIGGTADRQQPKAPAGAPSPTANAEDAQTSPSADPAPAGPGKTELSPAARQQAAAGGVTNEQQLRAALKGAAPGTTVRLDADVRTTGSIVIPDGVSIDGTNPDARNDQDHRKIIQTSLPSQPGVPGKEYQSQAPALLVKGSNSKISNLGIEVNNRHGTSSGISLENNAGARTNNTVIENVTIRNAHTGIRSEGALPKDLVIKDSTIINATKGVELLRDSLKGGGPVDAVRSSRKAPNGDAIDYQSGGKLEIRNNSFYSEPGHPAMQVGISIDAGNDGRFDEKVDGFKDSQSPKRTPFDNDVTRYDRAFIRDNHGRTPDDSIKATQFGIALSKVANVTVVTNNVETVSDPRSGTNYSSALNVENLAHDINLTSNRITVSRYSETSQNHGVALSPLNDHGRDASSSTGVMNVNIENNEFRGTGRTAIIAQGARGTTIAGSNDFSQFTPFSKTKDGTAHHVKGLSIDDNGDKIRNRNEMAVPTFTGNFPDGFTSDLTGLVTEKSDQSPGMRNELEQARRAARSARS